MPHYLGNIAFLVGARVIASVWFVGRHRLRTRKNFIGVAGYVTRSITVSLAIGHPVRRNLTCASLAVSNLLCGAIGVIRLQKSRRVFVWLVMRLLQSVLTVIALIQLRKWLGGIVRTKTALIESTSAMIAWPLMVLVLYFASLATLLTVTSAFCVTKHTHEETPVVIFIGVRRA